MSKAASPYSGLGRTHFWRRSISNIERHQVDPVVSPRFSISKSETVATAGSCFAQHIARALQVLDFNYLVAERSQELSAQAALERGYGVFSARYGNIYTARQLLQLFQRAQSEIQPAEDFWKRPDGHFADPYRPNVEPGGFRSLSQLHRDREAHLRSVRTMFAEADVFVFTMGLTEAWRSRRDGAVFPIVPGVTAGEYDPDLHEFVNFDVAETVADMQDFLDRLFTVNPLVKVLLTVSPVPLIATYEDRHVLSATTYSKAVLRVAAEQLIRSNAGVDYFPSYEIITGSYNGGVYYEADARQVTRAGVSHAMRCFARHYLEGAAEAPAAAIVPASIPAEASSGIICDEEAIDQIRA